MEVMQSKRSVMTGTKTPNEFSFQNRAGNLMQSDSTMYTFEGEDDKWLTNSARLLQTSPGKPSNILNKLLIYLITGAEWLNNGLPARHLIVCHIVNL